MTYTYDSPSEKTDECGMNTIDGFGTCFDFDDEKEKRVGTISALLVDTDKLSLPLRDALDTQSDYSLFMNAFNSNGELAEEAYTLLKCTRDDIYSPYILMLDRLYINPEYRAQGFANIFFSDLIENFAPSIQYSLLYASPLQIMTDVEKEKIVKQNLGQFRHLSDEEATKKLISYYKNAGYSSFSYDKSLMIRKENF